MTNEQFTKQQMIQFADYCISQYGLTNDLLDSFLLKIEQADTASLFKKGQLVKWVRDGIANPGIVREVNHDICNGTTTIVVDFNNGKASFFGDGRYLYIDREPSLFHI